MIGNPRSTIGDTGLSATVGSALDKYGLNTLSEETGPLDWTEPEIKPKKFKPSDVNPIQKANVGGPLMLLVLGLAAIYAIKKLT